MLNDDLANDVATACQIWLIRSRTFLSSGTQARTMRERI